MKKCSNLIGAMEAVNHSKNSSMETDTISKNGKTPMSRAIVVIVLIAASMAFIIEGYSQGVTITDPWTGQTRTGKIVIPDTPPATQTSTGGSSGSSGNGGFTSEIYRLLSGIDDLTYDELKERDKALSGKIRRHDPDDNYYSLNKEIEKARNRIQSRLDERESRLDERERELKAEREKKEKEKQAQLFNENKQRISNSLMDVKSASSRPAEYKPIINEYNTSSMLDVSVNPAKMQEMERNIRMKENVIAKSMTNKEQLESELGKIILPLDRAAKALGNKYYDTMFNHVLEIIAQTTGVHKQVLENIAWTFDNYKKNTEEAVSDYYTAILLALDGKPDDALQLLEKRNRKIEQFGKDCYERAKKSLSAS